MKITEKHYTHEVCIKNAHKILVVKSADKAPQRPGSKNLFMLTLCRVHNAPRKYFMHRAVVAQRVLDAEKESSTSDYRPSISWQ